MARVALDSGVLIAIERGSPVATAWLRNQREGRRPPVVSAAAVAETWREPPRLRLVRALRVCDIEPVDEPLARAAGVAIGVTGASLGDALIAASAARAGALLLTADQDDMQALSSHFRSLRLATL